MVQAQVKELLPNGGAVIAINGQTYFALTRANAEEVAATKLELEGVRKQIINLETQIAVAGEKESALRQQIALREAQLTAEQRFRESEVVRLTQIIELKDQIIAACEKLKTKSTLGRFFDSLPVKIVAIVLGPLVTYLTAR